MWIAAQFDTCTTPRPIRFCASEGRAYSRRHPTLPRIARPHLIPHRATCALPLPRACAVPAPARGMGAEHPTMATMWKRATIACACDPQRAVGISIRKQLHLPLDQAHRRALAAAGVRVERAQPTVTRACICSPAPSPPLPVSAPSAPPCARSSLSSSARPPHHPPPARQLRLRQPSTWPSTRSASRGGARLGISNCVAGRARSCVAATSCAPPLCCGGPLSRAHAGCGKEVQIPHALPASADVSQCTDILLSQQLRRALLRSLGA